MQKREVKLTGYSAKSFGPDGHIQVGREIGKERLEAICFHNQLLAFGIVLNDSRHNIGCFCSNAGVRVFKVTNKRNKTTNGMKICDKMKTDKPVDMNVSFIKIAQIFANFTNV